MAAPKKTAKSPSQKRGQTGKTAGSVSTQFKPGQSGNPGGRPAIIREVRDLARENTAIAFGTLLAACQAEDAPWAARVAAAAHILDRGYGKPTQNIHAAVRNAQKMTDDELVAFLTGASDQGERGEGAVETAVH